MVDMTDEQKAAAQKIFEGADDSRSACIHCAGLHAVLANRTPGQQPCPRIKKIEYHPGGEMASVEYWPPDSGWDLNVIFPHQVYDD